jgi:hypothetical protein
MLISVASEFSKKFRSIGANINDISSKVATISKTVSTSENGIGDGEVGADALSANSIANDSIAAQSITADKLDLGSVSSPGSNQRIPAPLNSIEYWTPVLIENSALHTEPYFKDVSIRNVSVDANGLTFSPERATPVTITNAELENGVFTLTTSVAHGYEAGDTIQISNLPSPFTGEWIISEVPSSTTLCYLISQYNESTVNYKIGEEIAGYVSIEDDTKNVTSKSCVNGVVTLSLQNLLSFIDTGEQDDESFSGHGYSVGDVIEVTGVGSPYDGTHLITNVPADQPSILQYQIGNKTVNNFSTAIPLLSALGDGSSILYTYATDVSDNTVTSLDFSENDPVVISGFTDTGYNITSVIERVGSNSFTVSGIYNTLAGEETAGSPQARIAHVKVDAEARLFLTGKTKVPDSRSISVSWVTDGNPINMYFVCWITNRTGGTTEPRLIPVDNTQDVSISKLQGINNYYWEIPTDVEYYSLLAEVLPGKDPVLLKEAYVFEAIGDQDQKTEHISGVSIEENVATIYTATTHPYEVGDVVQLFGVEPADSGLVGVSYEVVAISNDFTYFIVQTIGLSNTNGTVALSGTVIGGYQKDHISSISPSGLALDSALGQSINLTDKPTDNYIAVTTANADTVASISNTGAGTFKTLDADSLSVDGDITIGGENTPLVGDFINEKFNGKSYGGSLLDRLARGTIYQASWLTPTTNIPADTQYYGLAAGSFKLDAGRLYQIFTSAAGMRASTTVACAFEIMFSTAPIRVQDDSGLAKMAHVVPARAITTSAASAGTAHTHTVNVFTNFYWSDLQGHFYSISPTPVGANTTIYEISSLSRASGNANIVITLANNAGKYMESNLSSSAKMYAGFQANSSTSLSVDYNTAVDGTYDFEKINRTQFRVPSSSTGAIGTITRVTGLGATLSTGSSTITLISGSTANIKVGQLLIKTSGTGAFGNSGVVYVTGIAGSVLSVGDFSGNSVNHSVAGSITFEASVGKFTLVEPIMTKTKATFDRGSVASLSGTIVSGSNTITGISSTANISVGDSIYRVSGANLANTTVTNVVNTTAITVSNTSANTSGITFDVNRTVCTSNGNAHTYFIENLFKSGQLVDVVSANTSWSVTDGLVVSANASQFTVTFSSTPQANGATNTAIVTASYSDTQVQLHKNYLPSDTDLYYVIRLRHGASTFAEYPITVSENPNGMMAVTDLGQAKDVTFVAQRVSNTTPWTTGLPVGFDTVSSTTTIVTETQTLDASDSAYYDNYGKGVDFNFPQAFLYYLYQGNLGNASGVKKSAVLFPAFDFTDKTDGLTITKLEVYLRNRHSYNSSGLTAYLAAHAATTLGDSVPLALDSAPATTSTFTKGQGKWVDLPSSWYSSFTSGGTGRGILLGTTDENPDTYYDAIDNYGYFDGVTLDDAPQLRITYRYNAPVSENNSQGSTGGGGGGYVILE